MSLFSMTPLRCPNVAELANQCATVHDFVFRAQLPDAKSVVGHYIENAPAATDFNSQLIVKHSSTGKTKRSLLQCKVDNVILDAVTLAPITVNLSLANHTEHTKAQIKERLEVLRAAMGDSDFLDGFIDGMIEQDPNGPPV